MQLAGTAGELGNQPVGGIGRIGAAQGVHDMHQRLVSIIDF